MATQCAETAWKLQKGTPTQEEKGPQEEPSDEEGLLTACPLASVHSPAPLTFVCRWGFTTRVNISSSLVFNRPLLLLVCWTQEVCFVLPSSLPPSLVPFLPPLPSASFFCPLPPVLPGTPWTVDLVWGPRGMSVQFCFCIFDLFPLTLYQNRVRAIT